MHLSGDDAEELRGREEWREAGSDYEGAHGNLDHMQLRCTLFIDRMRERDLPACPPLANQGEQPTLGKDGQLRRCCTK